MPAKTDRAYTSTSPSTSRELVAGPLRVTARRLAPGPSSSGDIYGAVSSPTGTRIIVGDVMGQGASTRDTAATVLRAWRAMAADEPTLSALALRLHALIARSPHPEQFVTAVLGTVPSGPGMTCPGPPPVATTASLAATSSFTATASVAGTAAPSGRNVPAATPDAATAPTELLCCGHPPPLLLHGGTVSFPSGLAPCPPLGLLDLADGLCLPSSFPFEHDDRLLLYTDGVSEARSAAGEDFPLAERVATHLSLRGDTFLKQIESEVMAHVAKPLTDDALLLLVEHRHAT